MNEYVKYAKRQYRMTQVCAFCCVVMLLITLVSVLVLVPRVADTFSRIDAAMGKIDKITDELEEITDAMGPSMESIQSAAQGLEEIDFDKLPDQFVLKWNHDSKSVVICSDKATFDKDLALRKLQHGANVNGFWYGREWPYKGVRPRIIAEQYISQDDPYHKDLTDYKFFCFDGCPKYIQVIQDRTEQETIDIFDTEWNHQDFIGLSAKAVHAKTLPEKPRHLEEMVRVAEALSKDIPFSRIDLYDVDNHVYFGEVTLYPASGLGAFRPDDWNRKIGDMIILPGVKRGGGIIS